jgi:hypothetical protein
MIENRRVATGSSCMATNLLEGDTFGRSNPKYVGWCSYWELDFTQRKSVIFQKEGTVNRQGGGWKGIP